MSASLITLNGDRDLARALKKQLTAELAKEEKRLATAATKAASDVLKAYLGELRADVRGTGFHNASALANTWRGRVYPSGGVSVSPAVYIWNRAAEIVDAFSMGLTITAGGGRYFAIPVGPAVAIVGSLPRSRDVAGRFANESAKVDRVAQALGVALHYVPDRRGGGTLQDRKGTVLFVLVRSFTPPKRMRGRQLLQSFNERFAGDFERALERYL